MNCGLVRDRVIEPGS